MDQVSQVMENVRYKNINDSFDAMIDEANRQYQREEQDVFSDQDFNPRLWENDKINQFY